MTSNDSSVGRTRKSVQTGALKTIVALLILVFLSLYTWRGSQYPSDDCIYAEVAVEMLSARDPLRPTWQGVPFLDKGPLLPALLAGSMTVFGLSEFGVRLPSVVAGWLTVLAVFALARRQSGSTAAAIAAAGCTLGTTLFFTTARRPLTDMMALALASWGLYLALEGRTRASALAAGALFGASILAKLAYAPPILLAALTWHLIARKRLGIGTRWVVLVGACVAVAGPWHLLMTLEHGSTFWSVYLGYHVLQRASDVVVGPGRGIYSSWVLAEELPLALLSLPCLAVVVRGAVRGHGDALLYASLFAFCSLPLIASATAFPHYLLPLTVPAGLAVAHTARLLRRGAPRRTFVLLAIALSVANLALHGAPHLFWPDYSPATKQVCEYVQANPEWRDRRTLASFDMLDTCLPFYCGRRVVYYSYAAEFKEAVAGIPMLERHLRDFTVEEARRLARMRGLVVSGGQPLRLLESLLASHQIPFTTAYRDGLSVLRLGANPGPSEGQ